MADYTSALEKVQASIEVAEGDGTTPTRILSVGPPGNVDTGGLLKRDTIEDRRAAGTRTSLRALYSGIESNTLSVSNVPASYEEFGYWLTLIAPSGGGIPGTVDSSSYERTFTPVEGTTVNTYGTGYMSANLEYSTLDFASTLVYQLPAMRPSNFTVNWSKAASGTDTGFTFDMELMMGKGTATQATAYSGALSLTTPTLAIGNQLTSYIDSAYTATGVTGDTNIVSATFDLVNPLTHHDGMDGAIGHTSGHLSQQWTPTMTMRRKFSDTTELDAYLARTTRAIQIKSIGGIVGATTATNEIKFDFVGSIMDVTTSDTDGLIYADISLEGIYDSGLATSWSFFSRNATAAAYTAT